MSKSPQPAGVLPQGVPNCLKKRRLLNDQELKTESCREFGEKFLALGWWQDALEFFQKCQDSQGLEKIKNHSLETGDAHLLARLGVRQDPQTWQRLAARPWSWENFALPGEPMSWPATLIRPPGWKA